MIWNMGKCKNIKIELIGYFLMYSQINNNYFITL